MSHMTDGLVGFLHLQTPEDLFLKLHHDYRRLQANPADSYAAFDFFVTATHIPEWLERAKRPHTAPSSLRDQALLAICQHLGNGAKHFVVDRHDAAQHGDVGQNTYGSARYGSSSCGVKENLLVTLSSDEAAALGTHQMAAFDLAGKVLDYWSGHLSIPS
jgi:hypothetical protein